MADSTLPAPCPACGWTDQRQRCCGYDSHVKLFYGAGNRGAWALGSDFILKERPDEPPRNETPSIRLLKEHTTIPIPTIVKHWVDGKGRAFTLSERIQGQTLEEAWSPRIEGFDGAPAFYGLFFGGDHNAPHGPFSTDAELWKELVIRLEKLPEKVKIGMGKRFPTCTPYTLTHGDLTSCNIIVKEGHLAGIIDWEDTGYFPVWWQFACAGLGLGDEDADWKELLRENMVDFPEQREFWRDFWVLSGYPHLNERGQSVLDKFMED
ncbi:MAG: hypothetical protein M4579_002957 [Chaenotheca gracillima]|nr:MAG: hypothetical protein M4579_002957 [Chaenotheca gracillima]